jgi:hypothetical protein
MRAQEKSLMDDMTRLRISRGARQMQRRRALTALLGSFASIPLVVGWSRSWSATQVDPDRQTADLPSVKRGIVDATGYAEKDVELNWQANQFMVTIVNSGLNKATPRQREAEASKIVSAITTAIAGKMQFAKTLGMHIDYVARDAVSGHRDIVDGIDFRRDPTGRFVHHIT